VRAILQLISLSTSLVSSSLPAFPSQLQSGTVLKPIAVARSLIFGLKSTASRVDFFSTVEHEQAESPLVGSTEDVLFFTDRPIKFDSNGQVLKFLPGELNNAVTLGQISVNNAKVLPHGIAPPDELNEHIQNNIVTTMQVNETYKDLESFLDKIDVAIKQSTAQKVCIFIPGFSMTFDQSIASAGALQKYSKIPVVLYSWPSQDSPFVWSYFADQSLNERSLSLNGSKMMDAITNRFGADKVILVGFSQGAKLAVQYALERQNAAQGRNLDPFFAQVYSRADLPRGDFQENLPDILNNARTTALFVSTRDRLLLLSGHILHRRMLSASDRTGSATRHDFIVPAEFEESLHVIDDSISNNKITNHTFNARGIANWLEERRVREK
jgi:esterase/lipase superfamily enzyme